MTHFAVNKKKKIESQLTLGTLVLVCGGYFDALDAWQQSQGLRPCVDMSPPPGTCYFAGEDV